MRCGQSGAGCRSACDDAMSRHHPSTNSRRPGQRTNPSRGLGWRSELSKPAISAAHASGGDAAAAEALDATAVVVCEAREARALASRNLSRRSANAFAALALPKCRMALSRSSAKLAASAHEKSKARLRARASDAKMLRSSSREYGANVTRQYDSGKRRARPGLAESKSAVISSVCRHRRGGGEGGTRKEHITTAPTTLVRSC